MDDILIIGAGGIGREVAWIIEQINEVKKTFNILGFIDDNIEIHGSNINGYVVLGGVDYLLNMDKNICVVCAIADYKIKKSIIEKLKLKEFQYPSIVHPDVNIDNTNIIGKGCIIYPAVIITTNTQIGEYVIISPKCGIGHESVIKNYCSILWGVNISGKVKLEEGCLIGSGTTIIQGLRVGKGAIVGAGTVVIKEIPNDCTSVGNPAKIIKFH